MKKITNAAIIIVLFSVILNSGCKSRDNYYDDKQVVACINNYTLTIDDFENEAQILKGNKNLSDGSVNAKQELLQDIINKKLLIQEAQKLNFDKQKSFMKEIERYWEQALLKLLFKKKNDELSGVLQVDKPEILEEYRRMGKKLFVQIFTADTRQRAENLAKSAQSSEEGAVWLSAGDLPLNLENVLYSLKPEEVSAAVPYSYGNWAVIKVLREESVTLEPLENMADRISSDLLERKKTEALEKWVADVKNNAKIKINTDILDKINL